MTYINLNAPPPPESYSYQGEEDHLKTPSSNEVKFTQYKLGSRINPNYERGTKYTPIQKERLYAISGASLCALAAVGVVFASIATGMIPLAFIAIPFIAGGIGQGIYAYFRQIDLNSPQYREQVMQDLAFASLREIANNYKIDEILGYRLLDRSISYLDPEQQATFYFRFNQLMNSIESLDRWKKEKETKIDDRWNQETLPIRLWYKDKISLIHQKEIIRDQRDFIWRNTARNYPYHRPGRRFLHSVATVNTVGNIYEDMRDRRILGEIRAIYDQKTAPWCQWHEKESEAIEKTYGIGLARLEQLFREIKIMAA